MGNTTTHKLSRILFLSPAPASSVRSFAPLEAEGKTYRELASLPEVVSEGAMPLTMDYYDRVDEPSVAYHPIIGRVNYASRYWGFSTKDFIDDLKAAEANPGVRAHLIYVDSAGGEAFGLHEAYDAICALSKPCFAVIGSMAGSAGYYLACGADKVYATSLFSMVGSIGTMAVLEDDSEWLKQNGIVITELYSSRSPLKNKVISDALAGETDDYITRILDPMAEQFIADVAKARSAFKEDSAAAQGEIFYAAEAMAQGLVDGNVSLDDALVELCGLAPTSEKPSIDLNTINFQ